jgi:transcriptional regulator with XRE-family HTH domain
MPARSIKLPPLDQDESFGARLKRLRKEKGITQIQLAERIGSKGVVISDYERCKNRLNDAMIVRIAQALEITTDELLGVEDPEQPTQSLYRRFKKIETLPVASQKVILDTLDTLIRGVMK